LVLAHRRIHLNHHFLTLGLDLNQTLGNFLGQCLLNGLGLRLGFGIGARIFCFGFCL
jgi:hypothetical protein